MRGTRLKKANAIAKKRARRWPEAKLPAGRYRKWNQTCACPACRKRRAKDKGAKKLKYTQTFYDGGRPFYTRQINTLPKNAEDRGDYEWSYYEHPYPTRIRRSFP